MIKKRSLSKLILLSIITLGIYGIVFWHGFIRDINNVCVCDGRKSPSIIIVILLSLFTGGLYYFFWVSRQADRLKTVAVEYKVAVKEGGGLVFLSNMFGIISIALGLSLNWLFNFLGTRQDYKILSIVCGVLFYIVGAYLIFNAINMLIKNINTIAMVYNERCA